MKELFDLLLSLVCSRFYGEVRIRFENGKITRILKEESLDVKLFGSS